MNRFWSKVEKSASGCWEWRASKDTKGYGQFKLDGKVLRAHRVSFAISRGFNPTGVIMHICDNRKCVRPDHLIEGDQAANILDAYKKGNVVPPTGPGFQDYCGRGHEMTGGNIYIAPGSGKRDCAACKIIRKRKS